MKHLLAALIFITGYASANCESGVIIIKKGSQIVQNNDDSFAIKKGCFSKCDKTSNKMVESCIKN